MPNTQDCHRVSVRNFIDDEIGERGDEFSRAGNASPTAPARKYSQAVPGKQMLAAGRQLTGSITEE